MTQVSGPATYTYGHSPGVVAVHQRRSAEREAAFFLDALRPGMRLLDAGCGPGSITAGLAERVAPSLVAGVDAAPLVLREGRAFAAASGAANVRLLAGDAFRLPFPDDSFDAVFAHTLIEHVGDGVAALRELGRVLQPGGVIGARDCDWGSGIIAPDDADVRLAMELYECVWRHNGGHPHCGRYLRGLLETAGFEAIRTSASFRWDGTAGSGASLGELLAERLSLPEFAGPIVALGLCERARLERVVAGCRAWAARTDAFAAMVMVEAIGRAPAS